jgi:hypothetical protein
MENSADDVNWEKRDCHSVQQKPFGMILPEADRLSIW